MTQGSAAASPPTVELSSSTQTTTDAYEVSFPQSQSYSPSHAHSPGTDAASSSPTPTHKGERATAATADRKRQQRRRRLRIAILGAAILVVAVVIGILLLSTTKGTSSDASSSVAKTIAPSVAAISNTLSPVWLPLGGTPPPSMAPVSPTVEPTMGLTTRGPTTLPTLGPTQPPTSLPTNAPTRRPTNQPTLEPTGRPTATPTRLPTLQPSDAMATATFYAIGDVPYTDEQAIDLAQQMDAIPASADFVIHVGDIRSAVDNTRCTLTEYQNVARILQRSRVPVFLVPGDNEWNDCPNRAQAWTFWLDTFTAFESSVDRWNPPLVMERMPNRPETFAFIHRRTLFVGLNLVGGQVHDAVEWQVRLTTQLAWLKDLLLRHYGLPTVLFGHANPVANHAVFFNGLRDFVRDDFGEIPFLYLNGDRHRWEFNATFYDQPNWWRIMVTGGTTEPPLLVQVRSGPSITNANQAFSYDRQL